MLGKALRARENLYDFFQDDEEHDEKEVLDHHRETMDFLLRVTSNIKNTNRYLDIFDGK